MEADPTKTLAKQIAYFGRLTGTVWMRDDGAVAHLNGSMSMNLILELPQSAKREAELKRIKDARDRASVPAF